MVPSDVRDTERDMAGLPIVETVVVRLIVREKDEEERLGLRRLAEEDEDDRKWPEDREEDGFLTAARQICDKGS